MTNKLNGFGRKFTSAAVLLCMLLSIFAPTIMAMPATASEGKSPVATDKKELNYVSVGDSMANGYGFEDYKQDSDDLAVYNPMAADPDNGGIGKDTGLNMYGAGAYPLQLEKYLEENGYIVNHTKLATSAMLPEDFIYLLGGPEFDDNYYGFKSYISDVNLEAFRTFAQDAVRHADFITLGLGNANFGAFLMDKITKALGVLGWTPDEGDEKLNLEYALSKLEAADRKVVIDFVAKYMTELDIEATLAEYGFTGDKMSNAMNIAQYTVATFIVNYKLCVEEILKLNPDVNIIFVGLLNTTYGTELVDENGEVILELGNMMDEMFGMLNDYVKMIPTIAEADKFYPAASFYFVEQPEPKFICQTLKELYANNWKLVNDDRMSGATVRNRNIDAYNGDLRNAIGSMFGISLPKIELVDVETFEATNPGWDYANYGMGFANTGNDLKNLSVALYLGLEKAIVECADISSITLAGVEKLTSDAGLAGMFGGVDIVVGPEFPEATPANVAEQLHAALTRDDDIKGLCKIYGMFKVGNGMSVHPTPAGHDEIFDSIIKKAEKIEYDSKICALRDVYYYLQKNGYITFGEAVELFTADMSTLELLDAVYNTVLAENDITDDERIAIIGKVYTILKGDFLGNYSPALDVVGNIYNALHPEYLSNTEAFNIVDFVYDRIIDLKVDEQDIYAIATYIYKTLFLEMDVSLAANIEDIFPGYKDTLDPAEKIAIIDIVFGELENSNFVEEAPELAPVVDLYEDLVKEDENGNRGLSIDTIIAIVDIAFVAVAEKTENNEDVDTSALVTEVTTKLATNENIPLAEKAIIVNKVAEVVKNSNLGETTDVPVLPDIPDLTKIVGVLDRLDDKYITLDEANMLLGKAVELLVADNLNKETAVELIKEAYDIVLADLSDEEKLDFVVDLYEAIKAEYDLTDEEVVAIVLDVVVEYYDEAYAEAYKYVDVTVVVGALGVAIDAVFAAMDAVEGVDFNATLKADVNAILAKVVDALNEIKAAVEAGDLATAEQLANTVLALEDDLYATLAALAALGNDTVDEIVIPAINAAMEFVKNDVIPEVINLAGELAAIAIEYLLDTLDATYAYVVEAIVSAVEKYAPMAAEAVYNYLLNNPYEVIEFVKNYGPYVADFFAEYGDEVLAVLGYLAYTYGEDILAFVVENHVEIIEAFVYLVREYGDEAWALIEVYAEATGLTAQIGKQLGAVADAIEAQIEALKEQLKALEQLLADVTAELAALEVTLADLLAQLEELVRSLEGVAEDVKAEILEKIEALKALIESVKAQIEALKAQIAELVALIAELKAQIEALIAEFNAVMAEIAAIAAALADLVDAIVALVEAIKDGAIDAILAAIENLKNAFAFFVEAINVAELLMKHLAALADALASLAAYIAENIEAIKAALEYIVGALADLVDAIYAISEKLAVLVEALDALIGDLIANIKAQIAELISAIYAIVESVNAFYAELKAKLLDKLPEIAEYAAEKLAALAAKLQMTVEEAMAALNTVKENYETIIAMVEFLYYMATSGSYEVDDENSHYVALGDGSAAEGSYADMLAELLGVKYDNLAEGGMIARDILDTILANEDIIADADLITLGFSNATVLDFVMSGVLGYGEVDWAAYFGEDVAAVADRVLAKVSAKLAEVIAKELEGELDAESLELFVDMGVSALEAYVYAYVAHVMTLPEILETLGELAPNALIVVVGGYNDLEGAVIELDGVTVDLGEYIGYVVKALNLEALLLAMTGYNVVYVDAPDVETILEAEAEGELSILAYLEAVLSGNLLPSAAGHEYILDQILAAVEVDKLVAHVHEYDAVCDDTCNICGAKRVAMPHAYYNVCDADCNVCGFIREVEGHKYTADCDTTCNNCGEVREAAAHTFGDWVVTRESTKNVMGEKTRTCSKCGAVEWELLPVIPADKNEVAAESGLSTGAVVAIVTIPSIFALGAGGFAAFWFGYKKRSFKDLTDAISKLFASLAK